MDYIVHGVVKSQRPLSDFHFHFHFHTLLQGFPGGSVVKNAPSKQEIQVRSLGQEDPLEKEMATHSSSLAWEILWTEEPGRLESMGSQRVRQD